MSKQKELLARAARWNSVKPKIDKMLQEGQGLFSINALVERYPSMLTYPKMYRLLNKRETNGLSKIGALRKSPTFEWLIHERKFMKWYMGRRV